MKLLICGTRKKGYYQLVADKMTDYITYPDLEIIEGCCPDSADAYIEKFCKKLDIKINHFPSTTGNYLKRNIEMVEMADMVLAFWDGYSYGTAHTIAHAVKKGIPVEIIEVK